jgi:osmotically-inducible protein OsmY
LTYAKMWQLKFLPFEEFNMKKTLITIVLLSGLTTGCLAPVALVGAGAVAGASLARDSRSLQTVSDDTNIEFEAMQKLRADQTLFQASNISVTSFNYVVLLTGQVPSDAARAKAESIVQAIPRVQRVYNMLKVAPKVGMIQEMNDASISTNIKARMTVTNNLNSNNFKYVTVNKVVYLMGYASREQTNIALDVIRNSAGVNRVVNLVQINNDDGGAANGNVPVEAAPSPVPVTKDKPVAVTASQTPESATAPAGASTSDTPLVTPSAVSQANTANS